MSSSKIPFILTVSGIPDLFLWYEFIHTQSSDDLKKKKKVKTFLRISKQGNNFYSVIINIYQETKDIVV